MKVEEEDCSVIRGGIGGSGGSSLFSNLNGGGIGGIQPNEGGNGAGLLGGGNGASLFSGPTEEHKQINQAKEKEKGNPKLPSQELPKIEQQDSAEKENKSLANQKDKEGSLPNSQLFGGANLKNSLGQQQLPQESKLVSPLFGVSTRSTNLFLQSSSLFGTSTPLTNLFLLKNRAIGKLSFDHQLPMKESGDFIAAINAHTNFEGRSLEELRFEDYKCLKSVNIQPEHQQNALIVIIQSGGFNFLQNLTSINLSEQCLDEEGMNILHREVGMLTSVKELVLARSKIDDHGAIILSGNKSWTNLVLLDLSCNEISNQGVAAII